MTGASDGDGSGYAARGHSSFTIARDRNEPAASPWASRAPTANRRPSTSSTRSADRRARGPESAPGSSADAATGFAGGRRELLQRVPRLPVTSATASSAASGAATVGSRSRPRLPRPPRLSPARPAALRALAVARLCGDRDRRDRDARAGDGRRRADRAFEQHQLQAPPATVVTVGGGSNAGSTGASTGLDGRLDGRLDDHAARHHAAAPKTEAAKATRAATAKEPTTKAVQKASHAASSVLGGNSGGQQQSTVSTGAACKAGSAGGAGGQFTGNFFGSEADRWPFVSGSSPRRSDGDSAGSRRELPAACRAHRRAAKARSTSTPARQAHARVVELQWDLGGLVYEMAIRNRIRVDVLVQRAAVLQDTDAELAEVERILSWSRARPRAHARSAGLRTPAARRTAGSAASRCSSRRPASDLGPTRPLAPRPRVQRNRPAADSAEPAGHVVARPRVGRSAKHLVVSSYSISVPTRSLCRA